MTESMPGVTDAVDANKSGWKGKGLCMRWHGALPF